MGKSSLSINKKHESHLGFTLLELSVVVTILALLGAAAVRYATTQADSQNTVVVNNTFDTIEAALMNYRVANNRLPCPALINSAENTAAFGTEVGVSGDGFCGTTGLGTAPSYVNSTTPDPDAASGSDNNYSGSADPLYDAATVNQIVGGAIPTKVLKIPDRFAYDVWGRKILYVVDKRITSSSGFITYPANAGTGPGTIGGIVIKSVGTNNNSSSCSANASNAAGTACLSAATTLNAIYALVSFGKNGHGAYARNLVSTSAIFNAYSGNADELINCHCTNTAAAANFYRIFVQKPYVPNTTVATSYPYTTNGFDDIVRFKTRQDMNTSAEIQ